MLILLVKKIIIHKDGKKLVQPVISLRYCLIAIVPERVESTAIIPNFKII